MIKPNHEGFNPPNKLPNKSDTMIYYEDLNN